MTGALFSWKILLQTRFSVSSAAERENQRLSDACGQSEAVKWKPKSQLWVIWTLHNRHLKRLGSVIVVSAPSF